MGETVIISDVWKRACQDHLFVVNVDGKHFEVYNEDVAPHTIEANWDNGQPTLTCTCDTYQSDDVCKHIFRLEMELGGREVPEQVGDVDPLLKHRVKKGVSIPHIEDLEERYEQAIRHSDQYDALQESEIHNVTGAASNEDEDGFCVFDYSVSKEAWVKTKDAVDLEDYTKHHPNHTD